MLKKAVLLGIQALVIEIKRLCLETGTEKTISCRNLREKVTYMIGLIGNYEASANTSQHW